MLDFVFPGQCAACNALGSGLCGICVPPEATPVRARVRSVPVVAHGWYEDALRAAILAVKDGRRDVAETLGERVAPLIAPDALLVPVPTTAKRRRIRGMDGVALIAERAADVAGARVASALEQSAGDAQRGRNRSARLAAHGRFVCEPAIAGMRVVLIDDVCTTGATLGDCKRAVVAAGGAVEGAVVVALTKPGFGGMSEPQRTLERARPTFPTTRL